MLARAFVGDPLTLYMFPDEEEAERERRLTRNFTEVVRHSLSSGEVYATSGVPLGVASWLPPGTSSADQAIVSAGPDEWSSILGEAPWIRFSQVLEHLAVLRARDMPDDNWYLSLIGVEPDVQGQGLGSALVQPVLARADAQGSQCYVETLDRRNVPFYQRLGFEVVREEIEPSSGLPLWTFRREPLTRSG